jgi:membrane protease YdiL (CAAX protease family)
LTAEPWGKGRFALYAALIALVYVASQWGALAGLGVTFAALDPDMDVEAWLEGAGSNGMAIAVATIASTLACVALMRLLTRHRWPGPWAFLGLQRFSWKAIAQGCAVMALFIVASDLLTVSLGKPIVPPFMVEAYASAGSAVLLACAFVIAAPLLEELFFRGFLASGMAAYGVPPLAIAVVTSAFWSVIHTQYGLYEIATIFVMGLVIAAARFRFHSLWPCIAMHALANASAFLQTVLLHG